jgi:hypothetical protein
MIPDSRSLFFKLPFQFYVSKYSVSKPISIESIRWNCPLYLALLKMSPRRLGLLATDFSKFLSLSRDYSSLESSLAPHKREVVSFEKRHSPSPAVCGKRIHTGK